MVKQIYLTFGVKKLRNRKGENQTKRLLMEAPPSFPATHIVRGSAPQPHLSEFHPARSPAPYAEGGRVQSRQASRVQALE